MKKKSIRVKGKKDRTIPQMDHIVDFGGDRGSYKKLLDLCNLLNKKDDVLKK